MGQQIVVKGRASYLHAFEPHGNPQRNIPPRYGVNVILPVGQDFTPIQTAIDAAVIEKYPNGAPAGLTMPWAWGDVTKEHEKDHVILKAYAQPKDKPLVVDQANQPILDPAKIYSGCEVEVAVNVYAHNNAGVSMYLQAIRLVSEGDHLDGAVTADVFGAPGAVPVSQPGAPGNVAAPGAGPAGPGAPGTGPQPGVSTQPPQPGAPGNDNGFQGAPPVGAPGSIPGQ